jgi:tripartite-type tricarboxylate transporter receptor subunit TctC
MEEIGYASVDSASEMGLIVPAATPAAVVERLQRVAANAVKDETFGRSLQQRGFQPIGSTTEEFRSHVDREIDKWIRIIAAGNIKPE